ncbi:hypothetical protein PtB15_13B490 [Puccinia triticina]|nr:hypothetical protein PtB15_13B490 [Puccinia triticina]
MCKLPRCQGAQEERRVTAHFDVVVLGGFHAKREQLLGERTDGYSEPVDHLFRSVDEKQGSYYFETAGKNWWKARAKSGPSTVAKVAVEKSVATDAVSELFGYTKAIAKKVTANPVTLDDAFKLPQGQVRAILWKDMKKATHPHW